MIMENILSQEDYLYTERWQKKAVDLLIETISGKALYGEWEYMGNMAVDFGKAKMCLEMELGLTFSDGELQEALSKLHERYTVWKKLMEDPQVMINKYSKKVSARASVWERMIKDNRRVKWYGYDGEKAYDDLEVIFENPFKGKEDFFYLGEIVVPNNHVPRLDQVELPPIPVAPTPSRGHTIIDLPLPNRPINGLNNNQVFSPNPQGSPGLRVISKDDYVRSLSGSKHKKRLFLVPNSLVSSAGSSTNLVVSVFDNLRSKLMQEAALLLPGCS